MKYSNTAITQLTRWYKQILIKCAIFNAAILLGGAFVAAPANAEPITEDVSNQTTQIHRFDADGGSYEITNSTYTNNQNVDVNGIATWLTGQSTGHGSDLEISSSTYTGNLSNIGGAIGVGTYGGKLTVINSTFENNHSVGDGGAIGTYAGMSISDSTFRGNTAKMTVESGYTEAAEAGSTPIGGGAISLGAISSTNIGSITGTTFDSNVSGYNGGAIATRLAKDANNSAAKLDIEATFTGNEAVKSGGAIYNTFYADNGLGKGDGVTVKGNFTGNSAGEFGGAIFNDGAKDKAGNDGGVMTVSGEFKNNTAYQKGGAIYNSGTLNIADGTLFEGNTTTWDGAAGSGSEDTNSNGGAIWNSGTITMGDNIVFKNNQASQYVSSGNGHGSDIYMSNTSGDVTIGDNLLVTRDSFSPYHDCSIFAAGGKLVIGDNAEFTKVREAIVTSGNTTVEIGDNLHVHDVDNGIASWGKDITVGENATFENVKLNRVFQTVSSQGKFTFGDGLVVKNNHNIGPTPFGIIYNEQNGASMEFGSAEFSNNQTTNNAGVFQNWSKLTFNGETEFNENSTIGEAGALRNRGTSSNAVFNSTAIFEGNNATGDGGAVINQGTLTFNDVATFENNIAGAQSSYVEDENGLWHDSEDVNKHYSLVIDGVNAGSAKNGGAINNTKDIAFNDKATFTSNTASGFGGAIYNEANSVVNFKDNAVFSNNTANGVKNDIYNVGTINITSAAGQTIDFDMDGGIDGTGIVNINGAGYVDLTGDVKGQTINVAAGELILSEGKDDGSNLTGSTVNVQSGAILNTIDEVANNYTSSVMLKNGSKVALDADLNVGGKYDQYKADDGASIKVTKLNLLSALSGTPEETTLQVADKGTFDITDIKDSVKAYTSTANFVLAAGDNNSGQILFKNDGSANHGLDIAVDDTDANSRQEVLYKITEAEVFDDGDKTIKNADFVIEGENKTITAGTGVNSMIVTADSSLTMKNATMQEFEGPAIKNAGETYLEGVTLADTNALAIDNSGYMEVKDSTINAEVINKGRFISDPTTYTDTFTNAEGAFASFDADTFTDTATLANSGDVALKNGVTFQSGAKITGDGDIAMISGTTHFNDTVNSNNLTLASGAKFDGTLVGGSLDTRNENIDTSLGGVNNVDLSIDAKLSSTGSADKFTSATGSTIKEINILGNNYGDAEKLTVAAGLTGATLDENLQIKGANYYTDVSIDASGNLVFSDKLINTSTLRGTGDGSSTFVGDVVIGDRADTTTIGTDSGFVETDNTYEFARMVSVDNDDVTRLAKVTVTGDDYLTDDVTATLYAQDTAAKKVQLEANATDQTITATAANGLIVSDGASTPNTATLKATATGLNVAEGITVGAGTYGIDNEGNATFATAKVGTYNVLTTNNVASSITSTSTNAQVAGARAVYDVVAAETTRATGVEGTLISLTTDAKGNLVAAINEVDAHADANTSNISALNTWKTNLATANGAANAVHASNIAQTADYRFVTDTQIGTWNAKQNALTAGNGIDITSDTISAKAGDGTIVVDTAGIKVGTIQTANIANSAVTTAKIADGAVMLAKLGQGVQNNLLLNTDTSAGLTVTAGSKNQKAKIALNLASTGGLEENATNGLQIKAGGVQLSMINGAAMTSAAVDAGSTGTKLVNETSLGATRGAIETKLAAGATGYDINAKTLKVQGNDVLSTANVAPAYTGTTKADADAYVLANAAKFANVGSTAGVINTIFKDKQDWISDEFGYDTETTDANTLLTAAGYTDQNGDMNVGFYDALAQLNGADTLAGSVKNSIKTLAASANYSNTTSGLTATTIQGAIDEIDGNVDDVSAIVGDAQTTAATTGQFKDRKIGADINLVNAVDELGRNMVSLTADNVFTGLNTFKNDGGIALQDSAGGNSTRLKATTDGLSVDRNVEATGFKIAGQAPVVTSIDTDGTTVTSAATAANVMATSATVYNGAENGLYDGVKVKGDTTATHTIKTAIGATNNALNALTTTAGNEVDSAKVDVQWNSTDSTLATVLGNGVYSSTNYVAAGDSVTTAVSKLDDQVKDNADDIADINTAITVTADGTYIKAANDVKANLSALDTQVKKNADDIADINTTISGYGTIVSKDAAPAFTGSTLADVNAYVATNGAKVADVNTTAGLVTAVLYDKEAWIGDQLGFNPKTTDANTVLKGEGFTDKDADGKVSYNDAVVQLKDDITVASAGTYIAAGENVASNLSALDTQVKKNADDIATNAVIGTASVSSAGYAATATVKEAVVAIDSALKVDEGNIATNTANIGTLTSLTTDAKGNLVAAINEVDAHADAVQTEVDNIETALGVVNADGTYKASALNNNMFESAGTAASSLDGALLNLATNTAKMTGASIDDSGNLKTDYSSNNYVTDDTNLVTAVGALDGALKTTNDTIGARAIEAGTAGTLVGKTIGTATGNISVVDALQTLNATNVSQNGSMDTLAGLINGQDVDAATGALTGTATALSTDFTATNLTAAANELLDDITVKTDGNYIKADKTAAENLGILDTQVKANSDKIAVVGDPEAAKVADGGLLNNRAITGDASVDGHITLVQAVRDISATAAGKALDNTFTGANEFQGATTFTGATQFNNASNTFGATSGSQVVIDNGGNIKVDHNLTLGAANAISGSADTLDMGNNALTNVKGLTLVNGTADVALNADASGNLVVDSGVIANSFTVGTTGKGFDVSGNASTGTLKIGDANVITGTSNALDMNGNDLTNVKDLSVTGKATVGTLKAGATTISATGATAGTPVSALSVTAENTGDGKSTSFNVTSDGVSVVGQTNLQDTKVQGDLVMSNGTTNVTIKTASVTGKLYGDATDTTKDMLTVNNDIFVDGMVSSTHGLGVFSDDGDGTYTQVFDVNDDGNIETMGTLSVADGNFTVSETGATSMKDKLTITSGGADITGTTTIKGGLNAGATGTEFQVGTTGNVYLGIDKFIARSDGSMTIASGDFNVATNGDTTIKGRLNAGENGTEFQVGSTGNVYVGVDKFTVNASDGSFNAAAGNFTVDGSGNTTTQGDLGVYGTSWLKNTHVDGDLAVTGDSTVGKNFAVAGTSYLHNTSVTGDMAVTGDSTVGQNFAVAGTSYLHNTFVTGDMAVSGTTKTTALTFDGDSYVAAMDQGAAAITNGVVDDQAKRTMATNATVAKTVGNLAALNGTHGVTSVADVASAIDSLATNVETATGGTFAADGKWTGTITTAKAVKYDAGVAYNDLVSAVDQVASNIGTAAAAAKGNITSTNTVNANLDQLDEAIGDRSAIGSKNADINTQAQTSVAAALRSVGDQMGDMNFGSAHYVAAGDDLSGAVRTLDSNLYRVEEDVRDLKRDFNRGMASMAAMSALVPNPRAAGNTSLSIGTGAYSGHTAMAIGGFHHINDNVMLNAGAAWGNSRDVAYRLGVTWSW